jgi:hypothetical protein
MLKWCFHKQFLLFMRPIHVWRSRTPDGVRCAHSERRYTRVAFAPCLAVVYTFLPIKVLSIVFRGVISSPPPCYIGKYTMPSPYRREELIADTATLVYHLSGSDCTTQWSLRQNSTSWRGKMFLNNSSSAIFTTFQAVKFNKLSTFQVIIICHNSRVPGGLQHFRQRCEGFRRVVVYQIRWPCQPEEKYFLRRKK